MLLCVILARGVGGAQQSTISLNVIFIPPCIRVIGTCTVVTTNKTFFPFISVYSSNINLLMLIAIDTGNFIEENET